MEQEKPEYNADESQSGACAIILVVVTIFLGLGSIYSQYPNFLPLVVAFGLSAIAVSIFHLGNILSKQQT